MKKAYPYIIRPQDVDFQYHVTLAALTDMLLSTAGLNADEKGFGLRDLNRSDYSWVLLRLAIDIDRFPKQYEEVFIETWVEEVGRASTTRNFRVYDKDNRLIMKALSNWAMISMHTRRAQDLALLDGIYKHATGESNDMERPVRLETLEVQPKSEFKAKYSHIDINHHVNSIRYVEWLTNCFSLDDFKTKQIKRFEISYVNEIVFGDDVKVLTQELKKDDFRFEIKKNDQTACKARIVF